MTTKEATKQLHRAIMTNGTTKEVLVFIKAGADINSRIRKINSPLIMAISHNIPVVKLLLQHGVKLDYLGKYGNTPLIVAIGNENLEIIKLLITYGVAINKTNLRGETPLQLAIKNGNKAIIDALKAHNAV